MSPEPDFRNYINGWIEKFGTAQRLADAIGMSLSAFSRGVRNAQTLGVENCLKLSEATGESPGRVLRIAGKPEVADLLERLYTPGPNHTPLSGPHRELLALWDALPDNAQRSLLTILRGLAARPKPRAQRRQG